MFFKNCIDDFTAPKAKIVDSTLKEVETVTQMPREIPFFGASIDRSTPVPQNLDFDGMIVTNIDYEEKPIINKEDPTKSRPKRIIFSGSTKGGKHDGPRQKAIFVKNVKNIGGDTYEGDEMSVNEAHEFFTKENPGSTPLFFIHGFNNEPDYTLSEPCEGGSTNYSEDRYDNAPEAGYELAMAFGDILKNSNKFVNKNLICHSMGNYVLRKAAGKLQGLQFDNIILVAADLRHNLFDTEFINRSNNDENKEGLYIFRLLKKQQNGQPVGKIYCAYNGYDYALTISTGPNWVNRMGTVGVGTYDSWWPGWYDDVNLLHPEIRGHTENFDAGAKINWGNTTAHSYQWMDYMIKYYKSKLG